MALVAYICLVAAAAALALASLVAGGILFAFAVAVAFRHELRSYSPTIPHAG
jgi:hypothetical protein